MKIVYAKYMEQGPLQALVYKVSTTLAIITAALSSLPTAFAQNVGIGTPSPQAKLDVNGQIRISGGSPGVGKVLTSDALGIGSWMDAAIHADAAIFSGNGATASPLKLAQMGASSGQVLKWNGTNWTPADDALGGGPTLPWSGSTSTGDPGSYAFSINSLVPNTTAIAGKNTAAGANEGDGVYGESSSITGSGVYGVSKGGGAGVKGKGSTGIYADGTAYGVYAKGSIAVQGSSSSASGYGVYGYASHTSGVNSGIYGETSSPNGYGMYGAAPHIGIYGKATSFQSRAIMGEAIADNSIGVYGIATNPNGTGVYGQGANQGIYGLSATYGIYGNSTGFKGNAVFGEATGTNSVGVHGVAKNSNSTGVWGEGVNQGVYGVSEMTTGKGVYGSASHTTGANFGLYGESASAAGTGVYGEAPLYGVYGLSSSNNSTGVYGKSTSSTGNGVHGQAQRIGVFGEASLSTGIGVYGEAPKYGVAGFSTTFSGYGLYGEAATYGAYAKSTGTTGRAVKGEAFGTSSIGVWGAALAESSTGVYGQGASFDFYAAGPGENYGAASSIRWKTNIRAIPDPLAKIDRLRGVYFNWDETHGGKHDVGMIAEEVGKVLPEIVVYEENGTDASGMDYSKLTPLLLEGIKALKAENGLLKARLDQLELEMKSLRNE